MPQCTKDGVGDACLILRRGQRGAFLGIGEKAALHKHRRAGQIFEQIDVMADLGGAIVVRGKLLPCGVLNVLRQSC